MSTNTANQDLIIDVADVVSGLLKPLNCQLAMLLDESADIRASLEALKTAPRARKAVRVSASTEEEANLEPEEVDPYDKVKNVMLFTRRMWADDDKFRALYDSDTLQAAADGDSRLSAMAEGSEERRFAEGILFWRKFANNPQKTQIRKSFNEWRETRKN